MTRSRRPGRRRAARLLALAGLALGVAFLQAARADAAARDLVSAPSVGPARQEQGARVTVFGRVRLQVRSTVDEVVITIDGEPRATTSADGFFVILDVEPGTHTVAAHRSQYLVSESEPTVMLGQVLHVGETLLVSGDVNGDGGINVFDLVAAARAVGACEGGIFFEQRADLDGNGCVTTNDLAIVATNFRRIGPTAWLPVP